MSGFANPSARRVFDRYLTIAEEKRLWATIKRDASIEARRDFAWMMLLRQTGMRVGALAGLTVADARRALATGHLELRPEICKRRRGHRIRLNTTDRDGRISATTALRRLLRIHAEMGGSGDGDAPLVLSRRRRGMSVRNYQDRMRYWGRRANLPVAPSPHWLRHTLAKRLLAASCASEEQKLKIVQDRLGHHDPRSTAFYTLPDRETYDQVIEETA